MKNWIAAVAILISTPAFASMDPVPGSCSKPGSDGWSRCTFVSSLDGSRHSGSIHSSALSCYHYTGWEDDDSCLASNPDRCIFSNVYYAGSCVERVGDAWSAEQVQERCETILNCLNDFRCVGYYCTATMIRGGWRLDGVTSGH